MLDTTITLITPGTRTQDAEGIWRDGTPTSREIFARMESVSRNEFYAGGEAGFRPDMRFKVFQAEYQGEEELRWNGAAYAIYRTYQVSGTDDLELYVQRKVGVHVGENSD